MGVDVKGFLRNPINGSAAHAEIRITTIKGADNVLPTSSVDIKTDSSGNYEFYLLDGIHRIQYKFESRYSTIGDVVINDSVTGEYTLTELLQFTSPPDHPDLIKIRAAIAEMDTKVDECAEQVNLAKGQVTLAVGEVNKAKAEVTKAAGEVTKAKNQVSLAAAEVTKAKTEVNNAKAEVVKAGQQVNLCKDEVSKVTAAIAQAKLDVVAAGQVKVDEAEEHADEAARQVYLAADQVELAEQQVNLAKQVAAQVALDTKGLLQGHVDESEEQVMLAKQEVYKAADQVELAKQEAAKVAEAYHGWNDVTKKSMDWATADEGVLVNDGINPPDYSAKHYAEKAKEYAAGQGVSEDWINYCMTLEDFDNTIKDNNSRMASGFIHYGKGRSGADNVGEGIWGSGFSNIVPVGHNTKSTQAGSSLSSNPVVNVGGLVFDIRVASPASSANSFDFKFENAPDGRQTFNKSTAEVKHHQTAKAAFDYASSDDAIEVVTERQDVAGCEVWMEEVTEARPYVFNRGMVQSRMGSAGVSGVEVPYERSYFAQHELDIPRYNFKGHNERLELIDISLEEGEWIEFSFIHTGIITAARTLLQGSNNTYINFTSTDGVRFNETTTSLYLDGNAIQFGHEMPMDGRPHTFKLVANASINKVNCIGSTIDATTTVQAPVEIFGIKIGKESGTVSIPLYERTFDVMNRTPEEGSVFRNAYFNPASLGSAFTINQVTFESGDYVEFTYIAQTELHETNNQVILGDSTTNRNHVFLGTTGHVVRQSANTNVYIDNVLYNDLPFPLDGKAHKMKVVFTQRAVVNRIGCNYQANGSYMMTPFYDITFSFKNAQNRFYSYANSGSMYVRDQTNSNTNAGSIVNYNASCWGRLYDKGHKINGYNSANRILGSCGTGIDFYSLGNNLKARFVKDKLNHMYYIGGKLYQARIRMRTMTGVCNGDWANIGTDNGTGYHHGLCPYYVDGGISSYATVQGMLNKPNRPNATVWRQTNQALNEKPVIGAFTAQGSNLVNMTNQGFLHFLPWFATTRLNYGAFHPSYNPLGCRSFASTSNTGAIGAHWWHTNMAKVAQNTEDCFVRFDQGGSLTNNTDQIHSTRPDAKRADIIYADGWGGIIDYRLPAFDASSNEYAQMIDYMASNGILRGVEKAAWTQVVKNSRVGNAAFNNINVPDTTKIMVGDTIWVQANGEYHKRVVTQTHKRDGNYPDYPNSYEVVFDIINHPRVQGAFVVVQSTLSFSIEGHGLSGETYFEVLGDPALIYDHERLKGGWVGYWNEVIPNNNDNLYKLTRSAPSFNRLTSVAGSGHFNSQVATSVTGNQLTASYLIGYIQVLFYNTSIYPTVPSTLNRVIDNFTGVQKVEFRTDTRNIHGASLCESFTGKPFLGAHNGVVRLTASVLAYDMAGSTVAYVRHSPVQLGYNPDTRGVKYFSIPSQDGHKVCMVYRWRELYPVSGQKNIWGDVTELYSGYMSVGSISHNAAGTTTDANGYVCRVGVSQTKQYGWKLGVNSSQVGFPSYYQAL